MKTRKQRSSAILLAAVLAVMASIGAVRGQEDASFDPAVAYQGMVVYDASAEFATYFLVDAGVRRAIDPARVDASVEILGITEEEIASIPEGAPIVSIVESLPVAPPTRTPTVTPTITPTPGIIGAAPVTTVVTWGTPGPLVTPTSTPTTTPGATPAAAATVLVRPAITSLGVGRLNATNTAYASSPEGDLWRWRDSAESWEKLTDRIGLAGGSVGGAVFVSASDPPLVLYATNVRSGTSITNQVHRSTDGGENWNTQTVQGASARVFYQVPGKTDEIFMGTNDGLLRSDDRGETWRNMESTGLPGPGFLVWAMASAPQDGTHLVVGGATLFGQAQLGGRLFESFNSGSTWVELDYNSVLRAPVLALAFDPTETGRLLVGLDGDGGLREGAPASAGRLPRFRPIGSTNINRVAAIAFRPGETGGSGAPSGSVSTTSGTPVATLTSRSDGTYSLPALTPGPYTVQITQPPSAGVQVFAGTLPGGVPAIVPAAAQPTPTPGISGTPAPAGSGTSSSTTTVGVLVDGGIFLSYDRGFNWANANNGADTRAVGQVAFSPDGQAIFIGGGAPMISSLASPGGVFRGETP